MGINEKSKVWDGVFKTFAEAAAEVNVFEGTVWLDKIANRARSLLDSSKGQGSIPPLAVTSDYAIPFVAALASRREKILRILDWGGDGYQLFAPDLDAAKRATLVLCGG